MARRERKSGPERTEHWVEVLRQWQGIERDAIETTSQIMEKTDNLLIRQIMEIIRNDSVQHHRVQQNVQYQFHVIKLLPFQFSADHVDGAEDGHDVRQVMADGHFRNSPQSCFIERVGRLVRIALRLHRAPPFPPER